MTRLTPARNSSKLSLAVILVVAMEIRPRGEALTFPSPVSR